MELRILASEEGFEEINFISYLISVYKNPQIFFNFFEYQDISETGIFEEIDTLEAMMEELLH